MKTTDNTTTDTPDLNTPPDPLAGLAPFRTALDEFLDRHDDIGSIAYKLRVHPSMPGFFERTLAAIQQEIDFGNTPTLWPHKPDWRFPYKDQLAAVIEAQKAFELFKTSDPAGIALSARDEVREQQERRERERLEAQIERRRLKERQARIQMRLAEFEAQLGSEMLRQFNLDHLDIDGDAARQFLEHPLDQNCILAGGVGQGKTRCMARRAVELIREGEAVEWVSASEFANIVSALGDQDSRTASTNRLHDLANCETLFLDDIGAVNFTEARTSRFFDLIDHRHRHGLPIVISTNLGLAAMRKTLSNDRITADRILRRIVGSTNAPTSTSIIFGRRKK
jgi:DNA replication protein DnaC